MGHSRPVTGLIYLSNFSARTVAIREYDKQFWSNHHVVHGICVETLQFGIW